LKPSPWLRCWTRAVVVPAYRRATGVWIGAAIGGGIIFGPTAMHPRDVTGLALAHPLVGLGLALTWLLVFVPTARVIVRAEGARFLRSLPHATWPPRVLGAPAFVALPPPWLALWAIGDGGRGVGVVAALSAVIALVALWQPRPRPARFPPWTRPFPALRGVYVRALRRRAGDALVRGAGLALLAGLCAALMIRNNDLDGAGAATFGSGVIAVVLLPGWAGALMPLVEAQRSSAWIASSLGLSRTLRVGVLATVVVGVYAAGTLVALVALGATAHTAIATDRATYWYVVLLSLGCAVGMGLFPTPALVLEEPRPASPPIRVVTGAVLATSLALVALGWLGAIGCLLVIAGGFVGLLSARPA